MPEHEGNHPSRWAATTSVAEKIGCSAHALTEWVKKSEMIAAGLEGAKENALVLQEAPVVFRAVQFCGCSRNLQSKQLLHPIGSASLRSNSTSNSIYDLVANEAANFPAKEMKPR